MKRFSRPKPLSPPLVQSAPYPVAAIPGGFVTLGFVLELLQGRLKDRFNAGVDEVVDIQEPLRVALLQNKCQAFVLRASGDKDPIEPVKWNEECFVEVAFSGWYEIGAGTVIISDNAVRIANAVQTANLPTEYLRLAFARVEPLLKEFLAEHPVGSKKLQSQETANWVLAHWRPEYGRAVGRNLKWVVGLITARSPSLKPFPSRVRRPKGKPRE